MAYLLKILGQEKLFNGLNWFKSMQKKLDRDSKNFELRSGKANEDEDNPYSN